VYCVLQTFAETDNPAILFNGNNEYLHYQDTWYILGYKPDAYVVSRHEFSMNPIATDVTLID
jgi:hypothetical protein